MLNLFAIFYWNLILNIKVGTKFLFYRFFVKLTTFQYLFQWLRDNNMATLECYLFT